VHKLHLLLAPYNLNYLNLRDGPLVQIYNRIMSEQRIGRDVEGRGRGLI